jgi:integrase
MIMTTLSRLVERYLDHRRKLGYILEVEQPLRTRLILKWAVQPATGSRTYYVKRLASARAFAKYCAALDPRVQVPDYRLLGPWYERKTPHIYSLDEIRLIMRQALLLPTFRSPLRPRTYETLIGLIACTGLRLREALRLRVGDVDFGRGTLRVAPCKFSPERVLPLHASTLRALRRYFDARWRKHPFGETFFVGRSGRPLCRSRVHDDFRIIRRGVIPNGARAAPRIHDLRHTFATRHIAAWNRTTAPIAHRLLLLSRYLGHRCLSDTWWYISADPATLRCAASRFEQFVAKR